VVGVGGDGGGGCRVGLTSAGPTSDPELASGPEGRSKMGAGIAAGSGI
jgi:hypothetical protein